MKREALLHFMNLISLLESSDTVFQLSINNYVDIKEALAHNVAPELVKLCAEAYEGLRSWRPDRVANMPSENRTGPSSVSDPGDQAAS